MNMQLNDIFEVEELPRTRNSRSKPVKRRWREIEAIKDRQRLQKELMDLDICADYSLKDIKL